MMKDGLQLGRSHAKGRFSDRGRHGANGAAREAMMIVGNVISASTMPPTTGAGSRQAEDVEKHRKAQQTEDNRRHGGKVVDVHLDEVCVRRFFGANSSR